MKDKIKKIISEIVHINLDKIDDDFSQQTCSNWDSLNHLNIIVQLETEFNISIEPEEIAVMTSVEKIIDTIDKKV